MEWYQLHYCKPGREFWETYGGRLNPYKFYSRDDAETGETILMKRYPGCAVMTVKVTEVLFSSLETHNINRMITYQGVLN